MANQEQLDILKQGGEVWNEWREKNLDVDIDLIGADLSYARFSDAVLCGAELMDAILHNADLSGADLSGAQLRGANLSYSNLDEVTFYCAKLGVVDFSGANLSGADFSYAILMSTVFGNVDLSTVKGLETVEHEGPSTIGIDTIIKSQGKIPEIFLRGAGVPDSIIEAIPSLIGSLSPIDYYSCFISYSSKDESFAKRLYNDLQSKNVRCWFAPEDMKIGDRIRPRIDESIRMYDRLLLVLSEHSVASTWVEFEVEAAMDKEQEEKPPVLFPVRLDNTVMESTTAWAAHIKRTRNIGDFTRWKTTMTTRRHLLACSVTSRQK
jgi:uncharacterized protein YjbI with pentapeptide repeats